MSEKLVSVIIPTYRRPIFLKRAIESVLNQTYSNIEVIVVDDNDSNTEDRVETEKIMNIYKNNIKVTYLKHEKNKNGSAARNTGWRVAKGEYITFLDDDDEISNMKIKKQVDCLEQLDESWGMCYTGYKIVKENGNIQVSTESRSGNCYIEGLMRTLYMGSGSNLMLRKKVVDEINGYDESFIRNQDIEFMARALEYYKIAYIDEQLFIIYQEGNRIKRSFEDLEKITQHYMRKFHDKIEALNPVEKQRVISVISLERFRIALYYGKYKDGINILKYNKVSVYYIIKYFKYIIHRVITRKSYGFDGS